MAYRRSCPGSVGDEHERVARLAEQFQDGLDDRSVGRLAVGADQVGLADAATVDDRPHRVVVIVDVIQSRTLRLSP